MVSDETIEKAVEVVWECGPWTDQESLRIARALAEAGLLAPAPLTEEWGAVVGWANAAGQTEQHTGGGDTREEALADARAQFGALLSADAEEVAHKTVRRYVSDWETP